MKLIIDKAIPFISNRFPSDIEVNYIEGDKITSDTIKDTDALIIRTRTKCNEQLLKGSKVSLIATATIGTDHIDMAWCEANGITVRNAPGSNAPGVAQYVFSSLFKLGFDPTKDILGIVGYGHVGSLVDKWAQQMGIRTLISDPPRKDAGCKDVEYLPLEEVIQKSDAVTLHVPLTKVGEHATYHIIGKNQLEMMKPGAILINSSRGGVVNESSLKEALREKKFKAIVDVWENEPAIDVELLSLVNIGTPHIAGYSEEGKKRATRMALEAVAKEFDFPVDISGLECNTSDENKIERSLIQHSYNPDIDYHNLLKDPSSFETLRNKYHYRHEPFFNI